MAKGIGNRGIMLATALAALALCGLPDAASAEAPRPVRIPSAHAQPFKVDLFNFDTRILSDGSDDDSRTALVSPRDPSIGVLPFGKPAMPEGSLFPSTSSIALSDFNFGTKSGDARNGESAMNRHMVYGLVAKILPAVGRLSAGYFVGYRKTLVEGNEELDGKGLLLSWDRTLKEISAKLRVAVDYKGPDFAPGALNIGASYACAKNVSVLAGYGIHNEKTAGSNTVTLQVDIKIP